MKRCKVCGRELSKWDLDFIATHSYGAPEDVCLTCREETARQVREAKRAYGYEGGDD